MKKAEFKELMDEELLTEYQVVKFLETNALDDSDRLYLHSNNLNVSDILNGRYAQVYEANLMRMAEKWNNKLGMIVIYT